MASVNGSECQDEKAALVETGSEQDEGQHQQCAKQSESKLTLYHWTQSFNSQKVSVFTFQHHSVVDSSPYSCCISFSIAKKPQQFWSEVEVIWKLKVSSRNIYPYYVFVNSVCLVVMSLFAYICKSISQHTGSQFCLSFEHVLIIPLFRTMYF